MSSCSKDENKPFELLPISKESSHKWHKLLFEDEEPFIFHDTQLNLENELIFDLWENINCKFIMNIIKSVYRLF